MAEAGQKFKTGLVLGKFYPLTKGHQYLIETALRQCARLYVAIGSRTEESIPREVRAEWIRTLYPEARVVVQPNTLPYLPSDCDSEETFYNIWAAALREVCDGTSPEALFTSEDYGEITARYLGCAHVMVDRERRSVPISATAVRKDPFAQWDFLDPVVRAYFVKTICVYGPESTGKSTLCEQLARHFKTVWQPEWARDYLGERHCEYADMEIIAVNHCAEIPTYKKRANKMLFMDTDAITTLVYSQRYYERVPAKVLELADEVARGVDLYLFTETDIPWVADTSRDLGAPWQRALMRGKLLEQLERRGLPYVIISGEGNERLQRAIEAVERFVREKYRGSSK